MTKSITWRSIFATSIFSIVGILLTSVLFSPTSYAVQSVPYQMNFQGRLNDSTGAPMANGTYNMKFRIYSVVSGGSSLWSEQRSVFSGTGVTITTGGLFSVQLGSVTSLPPSIFNSASPLYLEVELPTPATATCSTSGCESYTEGAMTPRNPVESSPYAINSDLLDGMDSSAFATATGGSGYIQNQTASAQTANFRINGTGSIQGSSTTAFQVQNAAGGTIFSTDTTTNQTNIIGNLNLSQVSAPASAPTVAVGAAGSLTGTYYYVVTYVTASGETAYGTASSAVSPSSQQVNLTAIPTSANSLVTARKIYRGTSVGGPFSLVTTIANNTATTYTDNVTSLGSTAKNINSTANVLQNGATILQSDASTYNVSLGSSALALNTLGTYNVAVGGSALYNNTSGSSNIAIGSYTLTANTAGFSNAAVGGNALVANTTGANNSALGLYSLSNNVSGNGNTALGYNAGYKNTSGSSNTAIGYNAGNCDITNTTFCTSASIQNASAIGAYAQVQAGNSLVLGSVDQGTKVGIGTTVPSNVLSVSPVDLNSATITATQSGTTVTASGAIFSAANVGEILIWSDGSTNTITGYTDTTHVTVQLSATRSTGSYFRTHFVGLQVASSGNVGIGTTNPQYNLDVNGTANATTLYQGGSAINGQFIQNTTSTQTANFHITGSGVASTLQAGNFDAWGAIPLNFGQTNASSINVGNTSSNITTTINGTAVVKSTAANVASAFQVQNASGNSLFNVDTLNSNISLLGNNSPTLSTWNTTTAMSIGANTARVRGGAITSNGYLYYLGGVDGTGTTIATVQYAKLNANGTVGTWSSTTSLPGALKQFQPVVANGYIYVIGGRDNSNTVQSTSYYAKLNNDGTIGTWNTTTNLTAARFGQGSFAYNGYMYVVGGFDSTTTVQTTDYYARINGDGTLGSWSTTTALSAGVATINGSTVVANGYVYIVGGWTGSTTTSNILYAKLNIDGTIGTWTTQTAALTGGGDEDWQTFVSNGYLYAIGGDSGARVLALQLGATGALGTATTLAAFPQNPMGEAFGATANGYFYLLGGSSALDGGGTVYNSVYYASTSRVQVGGNLDLVGYSGQNLAEGGTGGQLTAGNTSIVGTLQVQDAATFARNVAIGGTLTAAGPVMINPSTNTTNAFQVQAQDGNSVLRVDTTNERVAIGVISDPINAKLNIATGTTVALRAYQSSTYDIFQLANATGDVFNVTNTGNTTVKPNANSTTAFQVQSATGGVVLNTNTITGQISIGTAGASSGTLSLQGGLTTAQLAAPSTPTITNGGTAGSVSYSYAVTALDGSGETVASSNGTTTTGNATLTASNYNIITWTKVNGATSYKVYRTASAGSPATTGLISTVTASGTGTTMSLNDTGLAASGSSPVSNTTGGIQLAGSGNINTGGSITATGGFYLYGWWPVLTGTNNRVGVNTGLGNVSKGIDFGANWSGSLTAENVMYNFQGNGSTLGGNVTTMRGTLFNASSYSGAYTITNAATVAVSGAPTGTGGATITNAYSIWSQGGTVRVDTGSAATVGLKVGGAASQTGDLLQLQNSSAATLSKFNANGDLIIGGSSSATSANALQVQNTSGVSLLTVSTSANQVTIGTGATGNTTGYNLVLDNKTNAGDPTGVTGAMYYNSSTGNFRCYQASAWQNCASGALYSVTADSTTINGSVSTAQNLSTTYTVPANYCTAGRVIHVTADGVTTSGTTAQPMRFDVYLGSVALTDTTPGNNVVTPSASGTNLPWNVEYNFTCRSAPGASATIYGQGVLSIKTATGNSVMQVLSPASASGATVATNASQSLALAITFGGTASSSNTLTLKQMYVNSY